MRKWSRFGFRVQWSSGEFDKAAVVKDVASMVIFVWFVFYHGERSADR